MCAKFTCACSYDRAGLGWSDADPMPRTAQRIVNELRTLLTNARTKGPYVLVGHSFGGLAVRLYAAQYPEEVVGMVLVDPTHPSQWLQMTKDKGNDLKQVHASPAVVKSLLAWGLHVSLHFWLVRAR